jgi:hypothetical protein
MTTTTKASKKYREPAFQCTCCGALADTRTRLPVDWKLISRKVVCGLCVMNARQVAHVFASVNCSNPTHFRCGCF